VGLRSSASWLLVCTLALAGLAVAADEADERQLTQPISSEEPLQLEVGMILVDLHDIDDAGAQIGVATSSMLTLIAYRFILGNLLPRISYLTELDYFILGSTILVFLALIEVVIASSLANAGRGERARRLDGGARLAFPLSYALLVIVVFVL